MDECNSDYQETIDQEVPGVETMKVDLETMQGVKEYHALVEEGNDNGWVAAEELVEVRQ